MTVQNLMSVGNMEKFTEEGGYAITFLDQSAIFLCGGATEFSDRS
jgi:hypothetical protein